MITRENIAEFLPNHNVMMSEEEFLTARKFKNNDDDFSEILKGFSAIENVSEELKKYAID
ncbi:MAG: hypothetical protein FWH05_02570 [Oscillospiraceae bacterium]|nr:hypothetical protein [Oscillospiraceae bacterium]